MVSDPYLIDGWVYTMLHLWCKHIRSNRPKYVRTDVALKYAIVKIHKCTDICPLSRCIPWARFEVSMANNSKFIE